MEIFIMRKSLLLLLSLCLLLGLPVLAQAQWDVSPSEVWYYYKTGESFAVEVALSGSGDEIDALGFDFHFPNDFLQFDGADFTGTLMDAWAFKNAEDADSLVRIGGFTTSSLISTPGTLVKLNFTVIADRGWGLFVIDSFTDDLSEATSTTAEFEIEFGYSSIRDIQYTEDPSGDSPLNGEEVLIAGIVTAEHRGDVSENGGISDYYFFMMDAAEAWSGIKVIYDEGMTAEGDSITLSATVEEKYGQTQLIDVIDLTIHSTRNPLPGPLDVTTAEAGTEAYESCLVRVTDATVTEIEIGSYHNWKVDDGSGAIKMDTRAQYYYSPEVGDPIASLTGIVLYGYGEYTLAPRLAWDIVEGGEFTRIQRIQQVRNSDLLLALEDGLSDVSYATNPENPFDAENYPGDTVTVKGIVTMPTGLSYAGNGIKFIFSESGGGPWSSILSYNPDSTAYPVLFEGDSIEMTGHITEYRTTESNMTEFWILSPIDIKDVGKTVPEPDFVNTGDLRVPETAEQWGTCMVYVKDATIVDVNPAFELFAVDDGSGSVLVDDDSDSLDQYYSVHEVPPLGTIADSIRGWVYHHYGSYLDSTIYKLEPLYMSDILWGAGPPAISDVTRDIAIPTSADAVTITATVVTNLSITEAAIYYEVAGSGYAAESSTVYQKVVMSNIGGDTYEGQIPPQADGSFVNFYIEASDNIDQQTTYPADLSVQNLTYIVKDGQLSIMDIQYTPWEIAVSPLEGYKVEVTGVVTADTATNNNYEAYAIQDAEAAWSGIFAFGIGANLDRGDEITVYGTVADYNPDWHFKWDNNTLILTDSFKVVSTGNSVNAVDVTTGMLAGDSPDAESYEGVLVRINDATLVSLNSYDISIDDGSGMCLVDGDFMLSADQDPNTTFYINSDDDYLVAFGDTIYPGEVISSIQGVFTFSFGTYKIEVRDVDDFGIIDGVNPNYKPIPLTYKLDQNFPNPFNPETRIYFEIPQSHDVKLLIYNMLGQKVRTLIEEPFNAGFHIVNWDGRDDAGNIMPTGIYIYRIKAGKFIAAKRMLMMK